MNTHASPYCDTFTIKSAVAKGQHRDLVGGLWDEIGRLQFDYMVQQGLGPNHRLLDIGCGCLRGGIHFIRYLEPAHYFGVDLSKALLDVGYDKELFATGLTDRLPRSNLLCEASFNFARFGVCFDQALAHSLFTHLPLNTIRLCLERLTDAMMVGGTLHATFFELPEWVPASQPFTHVRSGVTTFCDADPYHYRLNDFREAVSALPWELRYVGDFGHPRGQHMLRLQRTSE